MGCPVKAALLAPLALLTLCTVGFVSGVLAAPMNVRPVAVPSVERVTSPSETTSAEEVRSMFAPACYDVDAPSYVDDGQCFYEKR